jgi:dihydrolipoamide dehydrogenase
MGNRDFNVIVIGSGPGGYVAAVRAAELGFKVACVEKMPTLGGTCLNVGCIPSKTLLQSTEHYYWLKNSSKEHGIEIGEVSFNFNAAMERKEKVVVGLVESVASLFKQNKVERLQGQARFTDPYTIEILNGQERKTISAEHYIIATGSEAIQLPFLPFDEKKIVSSTGALSLKEPPKKMVVIGGGVIGVELASVYRRLGSEVTIVEMLDMITPPMDLTMSKALLQSLKKLGITFYLGAKVVKANTANEKISISVEHEGKEMSLDADVVLVAVGRRPYTKGLALEAIGVITMKNGFIPVDSNFRTSQPHIYAIGDVIEGPMLAHRASHEGNAAAELIAGRKAHVNYMSIPNVIYTHPEVAAVGLTEAEAKAANLSIVMGTSFFRGNARARCSGDIDGQVKVIGDKATGRLVGMHIIGAHASELIAEGMVAIDKKATLEDLANACHPHPTLSEAIMEASKAAVNKQ